MTPLWNALAMAYFRIRHPQLLAEQQQAMSRANATEKLEAVISAKEQTISRLVEDEKRCTLDVKSAVSTKQTKTAKQLLLRRKTIRQRISNEEAQLAKSKTVLDLLVSRSETEDLHDAMQGALQSLRDGNLDKLVGKAESTLDDLQDSMASAYELDTVLSQRMTGGGVGGEDDEDLWNEFERECEEEGPTAAAITSDDAMFAKHQATLAAVQSGWLPANLVVGGKGGGAAGGGGGIASGTLQVEERRRVMAEQL